MTGIPFFQLPFAVPNGNGISLDPTKISPLFPTVAEISARAHWLFGSDYSNFRDLLNDTPLEKPPFTFTITPGSGYTSTPTVTMTGDGIATARVSSGVLRALSWIKTPTDKVNPPIIIISGGGGTGGAAVAVPNANVITQGAGFITMPAALMNGLLTPYTDSINFTMCGVFQIPTAQQVLMGSWADGDVGGAALYRTGAGAINASTRLAATDAGASGAAVAPTLDAGYSWYWVGMSQTASQRIVQWGGGSAYSASPAKFVGANQPLIGIGNAHGDYGFPGAVSCAEFIVFDGAKSAADMLALYAKSKVRLAARSVSVF